MKCENCGLAISEKEEFDGYCDKTCQDEHIQIMRWTHGIEEEEVSVW
jgi:hypothetical protein